LLRTRGSKRRAGAYKQAAANLLGIYRPRLYSLIDWINVKATGAMEMVLAF